MRKGVIRPRQFPQPSSSRATSESHYANGKDGKKVQMPRHLVLGVVALLALVVVYVAFGSGEETAVANSVAGSGLSGIIDDSDADVQRSMRGSMRLADEDDEDEEDEDAEDEDAEDEDESSPNDHGEDEEDDEESGETDAQDVDNEEDGVEQVVDNEVEEVLDSESALHAGNGFDDLPDLEQQRSAEIAEEEAARVALAHEQVPTFTGPDDKRLTIDAYFANLNKKTVNISPSGSFKFVLVHAKDKNGDGAYVVQGCPHKSKTCKHPDAARTVRHSLARYGLQGTVLGGGRITRHHLKHSEKAGLISIFGYSRTYGRCEDCNRKVCDFVAAAYPDYVVRYSNQGYLESDESRIKSSFIKCSAP